MVPNSRIFRGKRRTRGRPRSRSAPAIILSNVTKKRKLWSNESMCAAMEAVKSGMSINRAAVEHGSSKNDSSGQDN